MSTSKNHLVLAMVCALTILPVIPPVVSIGDFGITLLQSAGAQTTTEWNDLGVGPDWDDDQNWTFGEPNSTKDATHTTTLTHIEVNTTTAVCASRSRGTGCSRSTGSWSSWPARS